MRKIVIAAISTVLAATATTASADSPSLAAPGDCAQPIWDLDTGPVHAQRTAPVTDSGGAPESLTGSLTDYFTPVPIVSDVVSAAPTNVIDAIVAWITPATSTPSATDTQSSLLSVDAGPLQVDTGVLPVNTGPVPVDAGSLPLDTGSLPVNTGGTSLPPVAPSLQIQPTAVVPLPSAPVLSPTTAIVAPTTTTTTSPVTSPLTTTIQTTLGGIK
jgi:hypothetical protein